MLSDEPLIGHNYIHVRTKNEYTIMEFGKLRCPINGGWYPAVFYKRTDNTPGVYSCTVDSFKANFEDVNDIVET